MAAQLEGDSNLPGPSTSSITVKSKTKRRSERARLLKTRVKRLEKKLELYDRKIRQVMETEVSLEEMDSDTSAYLKEDLLKRKFLRTWYELCDILHISPEVQVGDCSPGYEGTSYSAINRRVERLLRHGEFPDHWDVCQLIDRVNEKHQLKIAEKERRSLSGRVFLEIGERLKKQRQRNWAALFGSHLTDEIKSEKDPALLDPTLCQTLDTSMKEGRKKLDQVYEEFATRQEQEGDETASSSNGEEEEPELTNIDDPQTDEQEPDPALLNGDEEETKTTIEEERMEEEDSTEKLETEDKIDLISIDDTTDQPDEMNSDSDSTSNDVPIIIISD